MSTRLDETLHVIMDKIKCALVQQIQVIYEKEDEQAKREMGLSELINRRAEIEAEELEIQNEYDKLAKALRHKQRTLEVAKQEINNDINKQDELSDCTLTDEERSLRDAVHVYHSNFTKSRYMALQKVAKYREAQNYLNFLKIEQNALTMYNLAVSATERRNIIMSLQSRDWRSIGVDVPELPHFDRFDIENGEIKVPEKPLLAAVNA